MPHFLLDTAMWIVIKSCYYIFHYPIQQIEGFSADMRVLQPKTPLLNILWHIYFKVWIELIFGL